MEFSLILESAQLTSAVLAEQRSQQAGAVVGIAVPATALGRGVGLCSLPQGLTACLPQPLRDLQLSVLPLHWWQLLLGPKKHRPSLYTLSPS